ncbi:hypothetical protein C900_05276 [Fulvivirga imtechensis AK7]|uniref:DUF3103 domain-containing protein n=1 Tax=Fulvivirga imtechensis AK7 TaxID=1237149 RepID=L8JK72_9BACT|nr:DUF3103 family protein [Fulvivirga imtechensis]ELR69205.1 hypothetical protein C900_05276 [Fulvivirga imtechensis AK7]
MIKKTLLPVFVGCYLFFFTSCQENELGPTQNPATDGSLDALALDVVELLNESDAYHPVISTLEQEPVGISLSDLLFSIDINSKSGSISRLQAAAKAAEDHLKVEVAPDKVEIPELWLHKPNGLSVISKSDLLVAYPPAGDETEWNHIKAYTMDKKVVYLDPAKAPDVPVVVIEKYGFQAFKQEAIYMNKMLKEAGLQKEESFRDLAEARMTSTGLETTILDKIRLNDDQEPWILGSAEIYAITSGIRNDNNEAEIAVIPMYYLDKEGKTYYPNQILLFWDDYAYQAANIQLFEKDGNHNYQELVSTLVNEVTALVGSLSGKPWITALGKIGAAIVEALPDSFWTNDDDYVDSYYTIEKTSTYTDYYGAGGNAKASMRPYFVPAN